MFGHETVERCCIRPQSWRGMHGEAAGGWAILDIRNRFDSPSTSQHCGAGATRNQGSSQTCNAVWIPMVLARGLPAQSWHRTAWPEQASLYAPLRACRAVGEHQASFPLSPKAILDRTVRLRCQSALALTWKGRSTRGRSRPTFSNMSGAHVGSGPLRLPIWPPDASRLIIYLGTNLPDTRLQRIQSPLAQRLVGCCGVNVSENCLMWSGRQAGRQALRRHCKPASVSYIASPRSSYHAHRRTMLAC